MRKAHLSGLFILSAAILPGSVNGQTPPTPPAGGGQRQVTVGPALARVLYAPLVRTDELPYGELALNNRSPQPTEVTLVFHDKHGRAAEPIAQILQPTEIKHLNLDE